MEIKFESTVTNALLNRMRSGRVLQDSARMLRTAGLFCAVVTSVAACSSDSSTDPVPATGDDATNTETDAAQDGVDAMQDDDGQDGDAMQDDDGQDGDTTQDEDGQDGDTTQDDDGQDGDTTQDDDGQDGGATQDDDGQDGDTTQDDDGQDGGATQDDDGQDEDTTQDVGNGGVSPADTQELTARITTRYESPETLEAWSCVPSSGPLYLYQFYATGSGPDENSEQMGVVIRSGNFDDDNRQGFGWGATAADALLLDIPEQGAQIDWTSIKFESDQRVNVHSSIRGNMRCSRIEN